MPDFDVFVDGSYGSTVHGVVDAEAAIAEQRRRMGWREDMPYKLTTLPALDPDGDLPPRSP
ncbi:hypothetical protein AB4Y45_34580 [Paraburkholderia sp. EG287A]|uniref:hypothetical protein n=1 Tax=Paraburkholderia sp. EG287A TaxID=3237012 RepID=UPI0034D27B37